MYSNIALMRQINKIGESNNREIRVCLIALWRMARTESLCGSASTIEELSDEEKIMLEAFSVYYGNYRLEHCS